MGKKLPKGALLSGQLGSEKKFLVRALATEVEET